MKKALTLLIVILLLGFSSWKLYERLTSDKIDTKKNTKEKAYLVEAEPVRIGSVSETGEFTGSLRPASQFIVTSKVSGRLKRLFVEMGGPVKRGQMIAEIEDDEYTHKLKEARAEVDVARAELEKAEKALKLAAKNHERARLMRQKNIISQAELDEMDAEYASKLSELNVKKAEVNQKESAFKIAELELGYTRIRALWEGSEERVIAERFVDEGAMLQVDTPIVSVIDISHLIAEIHVPEKDYPKLKISQDVTIMADALPETSFKGEIKRISPVIKETSREAMVEIEIPNPEGLLKPGMFIRVRVDFEHHKDIPLVPLTSLTKLNSKEGVFIIDKDEMKARFIPLKLGIKDNYYTEVIEPAITGMVVTTGKHLLKDGSPVVIKTKHKPSETSDSTIINK